MQPTSFSSDKVIRLIQLTIQIDSKVEVVRIRELQALKVLETISILIVSYYST